MNMLLRLSLQLALYSCTYNIFAVNGVKFAITNKAMNSTMKVEELQIDIEYGGLVSNTFEGHCELFEDMDSCFLAMDFVSEALHGIRYTPSQATSDLEDFLVYRWDILYYLISRYDYKRYLEIGCAGDETFKAVQSRIPLAVGVDPLSGGTHRLTSDEFFLTNKELFDIIFIDGDHRAHQVIRDLQNSLRFLRKGGTILLHDCK